MTRKDTSKESALREPTPAVSTGRSDPAVRGTVSCSVGAEDTPPRQPPGALCPWVWLCLYNVGLLHPAHHLGAKTFSELRCSQILFPPGPSPLVFNQKASLPTPAPILFVCHRCPPHSFCSVLDVLPGRHTQHSVSAK